MCDIATGFITGCGVFGITPNVVDAHTTDVVFESPARRGFCERFGHGFNGRRTKPRECLDNAQVSGLRSVATFGQQA